MEWKHGEAGPHCFCGCPTVVMVTENVEEGEINLVCLLHTGSAGAIFPLPKNKRPAHWPNLTDEEMMKLVDTGFEEQNTEPGTVTSIDARKIAN